MASESNTYSTPQSGLINSMYAERSITTRILVFLMLGLLGLGVSALCGKNYFALLSSIFLALAFHDFGGYNAVETSFKNKWVYYVIAAVILLAGLVPMAFQVESHTEMDYSRAMMAVILGVYFIWFKPSDSGIGSKMLKIIGYYLLMNSVVTTYLATSEELETILFSLGFYILGVFLLYLANRSYIRKLFNKED